MAEKDDTPPRQILWKLARIKRFPAVIDGTVVLAGDEHDRIEIQFDFRTDQLLDGVPDAPILDVEPIRLIYQTLDAVGRRAPWVHSGRADFPRDLPHLNPTADDDPAWLCLARSGVQAIYDRTGIEGVLLRLSDWLADAKIGALSDDGWDPVPLGFSKNWAFGYLDAKALQTHAESLPQGGYAFLSAHVRIGNGQDVLLRADTPIIDTADETKRKAAKHEMLNGPPPGSPFGAAIPVIFCWPEQSRIDHVPRFNRWRDMKSLKVGLQEAGLWGAAEEAAVTVGLYFGDSSPKVRVPDKLPNDRRAFVLVVGLWRPSPLDPTIAGLAENETARSLELRAFYLERGSSVDDCWAIGTTVRDLIGLAPATADTLSAVSGEKPLPSPLIIGAGALGSAFLNYASRGGTRAIRVIDEDYFLPHNVARHQADLFYVRERKSEIARDLVQLRSEDASVAARSEDVLLLSTETLDAEIKAAEVVIDLTAEPQVRSRLSHRRWSARPIVRSEVFHKGRLGVTFITETGAPQTLACLYHQLIALHHQEPVIRAWLEYEQSRTFKDEELLVGFGCRSLTTRMPAYKVDAHASTAFAFAKSRLGETSEPAVLLHEIDEHGLTKETRVIEPEPVHAFKNVADLRNWRVVVVQSALDAMHSQREQNSPSETGGYLYG
ncbi:MAG TPA: hypothetical protein DIW38_08435, partial [Oceanicaulis sp.]|nr:hypothetical protein [Oceanicaulis sp.]